MKRLILSLAVAAIVFGGVYGLASSLGVTTQTLGSGNSAVAACQAGALSVSYTTAYDSAIPGYEVSQVTVSGLDTTSPTNCANKGYKITLTNSSNVSLAEATGTTPASGTSFNTSSLATSNVPATNVTGVQVTIAG